MDNLGSSEHKPIVKKRNPILDAHLDAKKQTSNPYVQGGCMNRCVLIPVHRSEMFAGDDNDR